MKNQLRIIAGQWRSRVIPFTEIPDLRPTPARVRETLFNWLQYDVPGSHCLDLFAGSGALGFEAASRGATSVVMIEKHVRAYQALCECAELLKANNVEIIQTTAQQFIASTRNSFDLIFMDPPFTRNQISDDCQQLESMNCLNAAAKIYIESGTEQGLDDLPENWQPAHRKQAGNVAYHLFERHQPSNT